MRYYTPNVGIEGERTGENVDQAGQNTWASHYQNKSEAAYLNQEDATGSEAERGFRLTII